MKARVLFLLIALAAITAGVSFYLTSSDASTSVPGETATPTITASPDLLEVTPTPTPVETPLTDATPAVAEAQPQKSPTRPPRPSRVNTRIKASIFSSSRDGEARTKFSPTTETIYLTATPEGLSPRAQVTASFRSLLESDTKFSSPVLGEASPKRRVFVFAFPRPSEGWIPGPYQVVVKPTEGDTVLEYGRFEIAQEGESLTTNFPEPEYLEITDDPNGDPRSTFDTNARTIHLRVATHQIKPGTQVRSVWSAFDVDKLEKGELVAVSSISAPGPEQDGLFSFEAPPGGFLTGAYQVDIYFEQDLVGSQAFFIKTPAEPLAESESSETLSDPEG